jgi:hypothetical protein
VRLFHLTKTTGILGLVYLPQEYSYAKYFIGLQLLLIAILVLLDVGVSMPALPLLRAAIVVTVLCIFGCGAVLIESGYAYDKLQAECRAACSNLSYAILQCSQDSCSSTQLQLFEEQMAHPLKSMIIMTVFVANLVFLRDAVYSEQCVY